MRSTPRPSGLIALALALVVIGAAVVSCRDPHLQPTYMGAGLPGPRRGGTFRFAFDADVRTLDPHLANDVVAGIPGKLLFDSLVDYAADTPTIVPSLAERWEVSPDGKRYTFHLRPNARFSNGRRVVSEDFRYSWERLLNARRIPSPGAENYRLIDGYDDYREGRAPHLRGVLTPDPATLVVNLSAADQTFLHVLAMRFAAAVPSEVVERMGDEAFALAPVGAGAFMLERWEQGTRMTFRRNPYYWNAPRPYLDRIEFELSVARHLQFMRFLAGEIDFAHTYSLSTSDLLWVRRNQAWRPYVTRAPVASIGAFMMNTQMRPFDNVHVRRAVTYAIDRESICRARNNRIAPAWGLYPPGIPGYRANLPNRQRYDVDAARREMALAGYPNGYPEEIDLWLGDGDAGTIYGQLIQADLARIGMRVRLHQAALSVYYASLGLPNTVSLAFDGWVMDYPDPANFIEPNFHSRAIQAENSSNHSFYRSRELDDLLDRGKTEPDHAARIGLYQQAEEVLLRDAPWAFVYTPVEDSVVQPYVRGYAPHSVWSYYVGDVWLDLPRRAWHAERLAHTRSLGALAAFADPLGGAQ